MMRTRISLSLALLIGAPALGAAQEPTPVPPTRSDSQNAQTPTAIQRGTPASAAQTAMYEDIEIMRRLLSRELQVRAQAWCASCHTPVRAFAFSPDGNTLHAGTMPFCAWSHHFLAVDVDVTYLKGYGVVLHVT